jgi:type IV secretory pathway VirB3-like protein
VRQQAAREPLAVAGRIAVGVTRPAAVAGIAIMFVALAAGQTVTRPILDDAAARAAGVSTRFRA